MASDEEYLAPQQIGRAVALAVGFRRSRRFPPHVELDEMIGDAYVGLVRAARRASSVPDLSSFHAWSFVHIHGEMVHGLRTRALQSGELQYVGRRGSSRLVKRNQKQSPLQSHLKELRLRCVASDLDRVDLLDWSDHAMSRLTDRERKIMKLTHYECLSSHAIAKRIGLTQARVWQIQQQIYQRLREC